MELDTYFKFPTLLLRMMIGYFALRVRPPSVVLHKSFPFNNSTFIVSVMVIVTRVFSDAKPRH